MFKKIISLVCFLTISSSANAELISYNNYTLDEDINIIRSNHLEWLQWDKTHLMSVDSALSKYGADGWQLASNQQISDLFNSFNLGSSNIWDSDENTSQTITTPYVSDDDESIDPELQFLTLFGVNRGLTDGWWY